MVCPAKSAWDLHRAMPEAAFEIVGDSGHSANEPGTRGEHGRLLQVARLAGLWEGGCGREVLAVRVQTLTTPDP